jgi:hydrogenase maturation protease
VDRDSVLIIGYGSELRGDDAAGRHAARRLAKRGFDVLDVHQLTPELAERVAKAHEVIFLDAHQGLPPGDVAVERLSLGPRAQGAGGALEHHSSPVSLLRLARTAYGAEPTAWLVSMGGACFDMGAALSPAAERAVARAIKEVLRRHSPSVPQ